MIIWADKMDTIRKCDKCSYETVVLNDRESERKCRHCKEGELEIIARTHKKH